MPMQPPPLLSLTIVSALRHIAHFSDLSAVPDHILVELFWKTLQAGKLTEKVLKLFMATGNEEILSFVHRLNIKPILTPVLPTIAFLLTMMAQTIVNVVTEAFQTNLTGLSGKRRQKLQDSGRLCWDEI
ncbi:hypothetical protein Cni_G26732 [Canna indica]|uniref:Uncharacterized protein n=1 Tax=Canna indica TaxID=4628 RepID=A0AAQ3QNM7_9LILI|nr:hypothetical protein Cni_G26732 [Canna indica]